MTTKDFLLIHLMVIVVILIIVTGLLFKDNYSLKKNLEAPAQIKSLAQSGALCKAYGHRYYNTDFDTQVCSWCGKTNDEYRINNKKRGW